MNMNYENDHAPLAPFITLPLNDWPRHLAARLVSTLAPPWLARRLLVIRDNLCNPCLCPGVGDSVVAAYKDYCTSFFNPASITGSSLALPQVSLKRIVVRGERICGASNGVSPNINKIRWPMLFFVNIVSLSASSG